MAATAERSAHARSRRRPHEPRTRFAPLESKLLAPRLRPGLVPRQALLERLQTSASSPVVCVTAPAGYGKTTLLAQWAKADARPFAWVSLDRSDNEPVELLTYIALALNRLEPLGAPVFAALSAPSPAIEASVVPRLGKALSSMSRPLVLVLDDVHSIDSKPSLQALEMLIPHVPSGSKLVLASRRESALRLSRLRAEGALHELGVADLAFDREAADRLLRAAGVRLGPYDLERITQRTEGWPAGLYLAALALRGDGTVVTPVDGFRGDDRVLADYFGDQVLSRLPRGVERFLTHTSVLDRLSGELCDAVLETSGSAAKLKKLERSNLFLVPLDRRRIWYRYHTLFGEMLRRRLHDHEPELESELHKRASAWYVEHRDADQAVRHAVESGNIALSGDLIWAHVNSYLGQGRGAALVRWLDQFREGEIAGYPPLALAAAWSAFGTGDKRSVERWIQAAADGSFSGPLSDGAASLDSAVTLLRAVIAHEGVARMREDAAHARECESESSPWRASACFLEGVALRLEGDQELARQRLEEGQWIAESLGVVKLEALCLAQLSLLAIAEESWDLAASMLARAKSALAAHGLTDAPAVAPIFATSTLLLAHRGEPEEARRELRRTRRIMAGAQTYSWFEIEGRLILARASLLYADVATTRILLKEARGLMRSARGLEPLRPLLAELTQRWESLQAAGPAGPGAPALTTAEIRLMHFLPTHLSFREIGERLHLSRNTVKTQAMSVYRKLDVRSRSDAVGRARDLGLLEE
jgi:LuxR family maltose regulon positive regulatory protein